jgi:CHAT domain-containing protein
VLLAGAAPVGVPAAAGWARLEGSRTEIDAIAALAPGATRWVGADASEAKLSAIAASGELARYDLLHFATHAAIDERRPGRSALVLSESPGPAPRDEPNPGRPADSLAGARADGLLTVDEIAAGWRLRARLVSLAACGSVLGPTSQVEGFIGLEQALLGAGAHALLVSLWRVDDTATALLMRRFYSNLLRPAGSTRMNAAAALREAQHWLRTLPAPDGSFPYAHPVYWSGIVLIGETG